MNKWTLIVAGVIIIAVGGFFALNAYIYNEKQATAAADYKDAEYMIDGQRVQLTDGVSEVEAAPGSASKIVTRYFGNELTTDLDGDGTEDVAFLLTQETGGSGTFFYVVGALKTARGYVGTEGYLLGDRIAPQNINVSQNPRQKNVIVANYADRMPGQSMSTQPSVGKSAYLKLDPTSMRWAVVEPDFTGESAVELNAALYPLYSGAGWGPMEATSSPSYGRVALIRSQTFTDITNVAQKTTPFEKYYREKLKAAGWTWDMSGEAGGPMGNVSLYRKGSAFIVVSYHVDLKVDHPDAPSECPCDLQLTLMSGTTSAR